MKIFVSDAADKDLLQIYSYLAERNPGAARSLAGEINEKFDDLSRFPFIGRERTSLSPGLRSIVVGAYVIFIRSRAIELQWFAYCTVVAISMRNSSDD